ncbi:MAG: hypothetical protein K8T89_07875 [Planctomycetes bacterium]|nr:hypothetical protein [Planctomycetota bacterium]
MWWRVLTLAVCLVSIGKASEPAAKRSSFLESWLLGPKTCPTVGCCPDDYCRRPCPIVVPVQCGGGPDDYCRRPCPIVVPVQCGGGPDDYCRKPIPCLLCPPQSPNLRCGPGEAHTASPARP